MFFSNQEKEQNSLQTVSYITTTHTTKALVMKGENLQQDTFLYEYTIKVLGALAAYLYAMVFIADRLL
jgi:hypothetical protein